MSVNDSSNTSGTDWAALEAMIRPLALIEFSAPLAPQFWGEPEIKVPQFWGI
jgi:hypothetical protein